MLKLHIVAIAVFSTWLGRAAYATPFILYSDLNPSPNSYSGNTADYVSGSRGGTFPPNTQANLFTVIGSGSLSVSQIDVAVGEFSQQTEDFSAAIFTDEAGVPGTQVDNAFWSMSTTTPEPSCCTLESVAGITGVTLIGGQEYFMVIAPPKPFRFEC